MTWYNPLTWFSSGAPEEIAPPGGGDLVRYRILRDKRSGDAIACRPADVEVPLATRLTEARDFACEEKELSVDEAWAINGQPEVTEVIRVSAATAQEELRAKLEELGYKVEIS